MDNNYLQKTLDKTFKENEYSIVIFDNLKKFLYYYVYLPVNSKNHKKFNNITFSNNIKNYENSIDKQFKVDYERDYIHSYINGQKCINFFNLDIKGKNYKNIVYEDFNKKIKEYLIENKIIDDMYDINDTINIIKSINTQTYLAHITSYFYKKLSEKNIGSEHLTISGTSLRNNSLFIKKNEIRIILCTEYNTIITQNKIFQDPLTKKYCRLLLDNDILKNKIYIIYKPFIKFGNKNNVFNFNSNVKSFIHYNLLEYIYNNNSRETLLARHNSRINNNVNKNFNKIFKDLNIIINNTKYNDLEQINDIITNLLDRCYMPLKFKLLNDDNYDNLNTNNSITSLYLLDLIKNICINTDLLTTFKNKYLEYLNKNYNKSFIFNNEFSNHSIIINETIFMILIDYKSKLFLNDIEIRNEHIKISYNILNNSIHYEILSKVMDIKNINLIISQSNYFKKFINKSPKFIENIKKSASYIKPIISKTIPIKKFYKDIIKTPKYLIINFNEDIKDYSLSDVADVKNSILGDSKNLKEIPTLLIVCTQQSQKNDTKSFQNILYESLKKYYTLVSKTSTSKTSTLNFRTLTKKSVLRTRIYLVKQKFNQTLSDKLYQNIITNSSSNVSSSNILKNTKINILNNKKNINDDYECIINKLIIDKDIKIIIVNLYFKKMTEGVFFKLIEDFNLIKEWKEGNQIFFCGDFKNIPIKEKTINSNSIITNYASNMSYYKKTFLKKFNSINNLTQTLAQALEYNIQNLDILKKNQKLKEEQAFAEFQELDENNIKKYKNNINKKISNINFYERLIDSVYNLGLHLTYKYVINTNKNQILYNKFYDIYQNNKKVKNNKNNVLKNQKNKKIIPEYNKVFNINDIPSMPTRILYCLSDKNTNFIPNISPANFNIFFKPNKSPYKLITLGFNFEKKIKLNENAQVITPYKSRKIVKIKNNVEKFEPNNFAFNEKKNN